MHRILEKAIRKFEEDYLEENNLDSIDIVILDNFTDYIVDQLEIMCEGMKAMGSK